LLIDIVNKRSGDRAECIAPAPDGPSGKRTELCEKAQASVIPIAYDFQLPSCLRNQHRCLVVFNYLQTVILALITLQSGYLQIPHICHSRAKRTAVRLTRNPKKNCHSRA
jgi:hypothetical protein